MASILLKTALLFYAVSSICYTCWLLHASEKSENIARRTLVMGLTIHIISLLHRYIEHGYLQINNIHDILSILSMMIVGTYCAVDKRYKVTFLGLVIAPLSFVVLLGSSAAITLLRDYDPRLHNVWIYLHTALAFAGYALFTISAGASGIYLFLTHKLKKKRPSSIFQKLPSLEKLDSIVFLCITIGFPMLTVALVAGSFVAIGQWKDFWNLDIKQIWSVVIWLIYACILYGRHIFGWRGRRTALLSLAGIALIAIGSVCVNVWFPGFHSFGR